MKLFQEEMDKAGVLTDDERDLLIRLRSFMLYHTNTDVHGVINMSKGMRGLAGRVSSEIKGKLGKDGRTMFFTWVYGRFTDSSTTLSERQLHDLKRVSGIQKIEGEGWIIDQRFTHLLELIFKVTGGVQLELFEQTQKEIRAKLGYQE